MKDYMGIINLNPSIPQIFNLSYDCDENWEEKEGLCQRCEEVLLPNMEMRKIVSFSENQPQPQYKLSEALVCVLCKPTLE